MVAVGLTNEIEMRVLAWMRRPEHLLGSNRDVFPHEIMILTHVDAVLAAQIVAFVGGAFPEGSYDHYKGHQWFFQTEEQVQTFVNHRPMREKRARIIPYYDQYSDFKPVISVEANTNKMSSLVIPEEEQFYYEHVEDWIVQNCKRRVGVSSWPHDAPNPAMFYSKWWIMYFVFEDIDDALLFRLQWT